MVDLTEARIREILAGCEGATPGPWTACHEGDCSCGYIFGLGGEAYILKALTIADEVDPVSTEEQAKRNAKFIVRLDPATVAALCNMALDRAAAEAKIVEQAAETMRAEVRLDEITGEPLWFCSEVDGRGKISEHTFVELAATTFAVGTIIRITEPRSVHQE